MFLPYRDRTFDRFRQRTTLDHLIQDFKDDKKVGDKTHLQDWLDNVISKGMAKHYAAYSPEEMVAKGLLHHHVWITEDMVEVMNHLGLEVVFTQDEISDRSDTFVVIARKK